MSLGISFLAVLGLLLAGGFAAGYGHASDNPDLLRPGKITFPIGCSFTAVPGNSRQLIVATATHSRNPSVLVYLLDKGSRGWTSAFPPISAVIGRNGFADPGAKREGDGKTPSGMFPLELAFGYAAGINTRMPYKQATDDDIWVDDVTSRDYNRWVKRDKTDASSFEDLRRKDRLYEYGLVIGYNTNPVLKGHGSAIFVHLWKKPGEATSGCLAMAEKDLVSILAWLDPDGNPLIILGTETTVSAIVR